MTVNAIASNSNLYQTNGTQNNYQQINSYMSQISPGFAVR